MNKKQILRFLIPLSFLVLAAAASVLYLYLYPKETIRIAVAGPMDGAQAIGLAIGNGVELKVDEINAGGGIGGKKVVVEYFNDENGRKRAIAVANEIAGRDDIVLVLGHESSTASVAAARIYRKAGIPAITASAMADAVTRDSEWYFRVISNTAFQGSYIAHYISRALKRKRVSMVYDTGAYGSSLSENFETSAREQGIEIVRSWPISLDDEDPEARFKTIVTDLMTLKNPGMLFLATEQAQSVRLLGLLRGMGSEIPIFMGNVFTGEAMARFGQYPQEKTSPGFFTNGIYSITPFLPGIANQRAHSVKERILAQYGREPTWHAYAYYDAATVALRAIENAEILGKGHARGDRRAIREALAEFHSYQQGIHGTTGRIFFDDNGDCNGPLAVGIFHNKRLLPTYIQHEETILPLPSEDRFRKTLEGEQLLIGGKKMRGVHVVFAGMDVTAVRDLDFRAQRFTADFIVWFRYKGQFDDDDIRFVDATGPVDLGKPIVDKIDGDVTTKTYRASATFHAHFDFQDFPFDRHQLAIRFVHNRLGRDQLIYVVDPLGIKGLEAGRKAHGSGLLPALGWAAEDSHYFQDREQPDSTLGDPALFGDSSESLGRSRYNVELAIARSGTQVQPKYLLPLVFLFVILYLQFFLAGRIYWVRLLFLIALLVSATGLHAFIPMAWVTERPMAIEWAFYLFYALVILALVEFNRTVRRMEGDEKPGVLGYLFSGISLVPLAVLALAAFYAVRY